jgi:membrane protein implicated in regulation of membrane protease activity
MDQTVKTPVSRRINWTNVSTVLSATILIGAEVFGAAFAAGWALAGLFNLGIYGVYLLQAVFFAIGAIVMAAFVRHAQTIEPFTERG